MMTRLARYLGLIAGLPLACLLVVAGLYLLLVGLALPQLPPWAQAGVEAWLLDTPQPVERELADNGAYLACVADWDGYRGGRQAAPNSLPLAGAPRLGCEFHDQQYSDHTGVDFPTGGVTGEPVHASMDGKVVWAGDCGPWGNLVVVENAGYQTWFAHLSDGSVRVKPGQIVAQGDVVGEVGSTGNSTGPHLHYGVLARTANGQVWEDPVNYFDPGETQAWPCGD